MGRTAFAQLGVSTVSLMAAQKRPHAAPAASSRGTRSRHAV